MHIETLKVFCDIIESGSVSYAASQNFVTQSAVSQQVRSLEEKYECRLLERARAGVKPTPAGQILYNSSKDIVRKFIELENRLREIGSIVAGSIRVGTVYSVGLHELPPYLSEFLRTYPQVNVHLEYLRSNKIYEDLVDGKIDLGVVAYPAKRSQIVTIAFRHDEMVLVVPPEDALAKLNKVNVSQLAGQNFVGYERDIAKRSSAQSRSARESRWCRARRSNSKPCAVRSRCSSSPKDRSRVRSRLSTSAVASSHRPYASLSTCLPPPSLRCRVMRPAPSIRSTAPSAANASKNRRRRIAASPLRSASRADGRGRTPR